MQLPPTKTPFTPDTLIAALTTAFTSELGHPPTNQAIAVLAAQCALECANGAACIQNNLGCYKKGVSEDWCEFTTTEYLGNPPVKQTMVCAFAAWPDLPSASAFYIRSCYTNYPEAWAGAVQGDADAFASGLKQRGYYTAPEADYAAGVKRWQKFYLAKLGGVSPPEPDPPVISPELAAAETEQALMDNPPDSNPPPSSNA